jgi:hypothetical protein
LYQFSFLDVSSNMQIFVLFLRTITNAAIDANSWKFCVLGYLKYTIAMTLKV